MIYAIDVLENVVHSLFRARHWADKENTRHKLRDLIDALRLLRCARDIRHNMKKREILLKEYSELDWRMIGHPNKYGT